MCWIWCTVTVLTCSVGPTHTHWGFPHSLVDKESACNAGDPGSTPGSGRSCGDGNGNPLQYSCLENPMDRGTWQATVHGVARVRHDLVTKSTPYSLASKSVSHQISHSLMGPEICPEPQTSWLVLILNLHLYSESCFSCSYWLVHYSQWSSGQQVYLMTHSSSANPSTTFHPPLGAPSDTNN